MPAFDGDPISVGDRLFEMNEGSVTVIQLYSDRILVSVPGKGSRSYSYGGVLAGSSRKSLFWHDPFVLIPRKDAKAWSVQRSTLRAMMHSMSQFITGAHYAYPENEEVADMHQVLEQRAPHLDLKLIKSASVPTEK